MQNISLYLMAGIYIVAGILHFISPRTYMAIMPPYIPYPRLIVDISGLFEILLGVGLLFSQTRSLAAWGLILLLVAVFPANIYMATSGKFPNIPQWLLWARLPLQGILIWWAGRYI
ncbi:DoxX family protein [Nibrella viscosa]